MVRRTLTDVTPRIPESSSLSLPKSVPDRSVNPSLPLFSGGAGQSWILPDVVSQTVDHVGPESQYTARTRSNWDRLTPMTDPNDALTRSDGKHAGLRIFST